MKIHKEGRRPISIITATVAILLLLFFQLSFTTPYPYIIASFFAASTIFFVVRFFRVPERVVNKIENGVISPADGTVIIVEEIEETEYFNDKRLKISIFMSIHNVHVNYFPMDGEVTYVKYHPGDYLIAKHPKSSELNERNTVVVSRNELETVLFRQIAGYVARRIVCHLKVGDKSVQGEEMGMIRFGSRVDVFLPIGTEIAVNVGDKVRAKKSVLAYF
ncbi:phosphatidylserine decarboxylase family protein [Bacteroidales bacterium OttesenSCG-928-B11]|nr:phosphatidylserine decarboxylase family protein [Bacteroidales bacterium OttesenSCG-928-C03]MDL2311377.1 phosphatidylserine decarboxylase family protein [Bacteroidales bacterium OttesenSCG-928-B11]MDL2326009.1 phosphatidylserine decarboxylase family protein [Bacteroidales bacterium OttesenSCG-928-A14]